MLQKLDMYDTAVRYWEAKSLEERKGAWMGPRDCPYGYLFSFLGPDPTDSECGCPVQVANMHSEAYTPELTAQVRAVPGILLSRGLGAEALRAVATAQRLADAAIPGRASRIVQEWPEAGLPCDPSSEGVGLVTSDPGSCP